MMFPSLFMSWLANKADGPQFHELQADEPHLKKASNKTKVAAMRWPPARYHGQQQPDCGAARSKQPNHLYSSDFSCTHAKRYRSANSTTQSKSTRCQKTPPPSI